MRKYIDAEKLKKIVEQAKQRALKGMEIDEDMYCDGRADAFGEVLLEIENLQQEQPMPDSTKLIELWHEDKEMLKEKDFRDDQWRLAYNAFMCGFGRGIAVNKQEQPKPSGYDKALLEVKSKVDELYEETSIGLNEYDSGLYNGIAETCMKLRGFIKARLDSNEQPDNRIKTRKE